MKLLNRLLDGERVDADRLIFRVSGPKTLEITRVYDRGVGLEFYRDFPTKDALLACDAEAIPLGFYATCLDSGHVRLGGTPAGQIVADVVCL